MSTAHPDTLQRYLDDVTRYTTRPIFSIPPPERRFVAPLKGSVIATDGLICAGKTTLGRSLVDYCTSVGVDSIFLEEKVNKDLHAHFYEAMEKKQYPNPWAFPFQMDMLRLCQASYKDALWHSGRKGTGASKVVIADRTDLGNMVFATMHHATGNITDEQFHVYMSALEDGEKYSPDYVVYLDVDPKLAHHRVVHMRVNNEKEKRMPLSYLYELERAYFMQVYHLLRTRQCNIIVLSNDSFYSPEKALEVLSRHDGVPFDVSRYNPMDVARDPERIRAFFTEAAAWYSRSREERQGTTARGL